MLVHYPPGFFPKGNAALVLFGALLLNAHLLEFFALSRGYAMGIAFMMVAINGWLAFMSCAGKGSRHLLLHCCGPLIIAVYAAAVLLVPAVVILFAIAMRAIVYKHFRLLIALLITTGVLTLLLYGPLRELAVHGALYYGGIHNFFTDTVLSLTGDMLGLGQYAALNVAAGGGLMLAAIGAIIVVLRNGFRGKAIDSLSVQTLIPLLLLACGLIINTQFYLLGTKLVIHRTALYIFPFAILTIFTGFAYTRRLHVYFLKWLPAGFAIAMAVVLTSRMNITCTTEWPLDAHSRKAVLLMHNDAAKHSQRPQQIFTYWVLHKCVQYYVERTGDGVLLAPPRDARVLMHPGRYAYLFLTEEEVASTDTGLYQRMADFEIGKWVLYKRK